MNREAHDDTMARVVRRLAPTNGSWWLDQPRDGWQALCERETQRMRHTKFGQHVMLNFAAEVVDRPRQTQPRAFAS